MDKKYTFKEILLALRKEILKNKSLINQLNNLVKVDTESVYYRFGQILKKEEEGTSYSIILSIYELEQKKSLLRRINDLLVNTSLYCVDLPRFCRYDVVEENKNYKLNLDFDHGLQKNGLGEVTIVDNEKFAEIVNQLKNSKLATIERKGIQISDQLYLEISYNTAIEKEKNSICYWPLDDELNIILNGGDFQNVLNTKIDASVLSDEVKALIDNSNFKSVDVELINNRKNKYNGIYRINEQNKKLILTRTKKRQVR